MKSKHLPFIKRASFRLLRTPKNAPKSSKIFCLLAILFGSITSANAAIDYSGNIVVLNNIPAITSITGTDTSSLDIEDTIASVASHIPSVVRHSGSGKIYYTDKYEYTNACHLATLKWVKNYPAEAKAFHNAVTKFLEDTDVSKLSTTQAEKYYDIQAQWLMVHYQN